MYSRPQPVRLRVVARIETTTLPVSPEPAEVLTLGGQARNNFPTGSGRNPVYIDLAMDLPMVLADRRRMVQVLNNLLSNAARYSPESYFIRVMAERQDVHVAITVADQGSGIAADRLPRLFRKFSQPDDEEQERRPAGQAWDRRLQGDRGGPRRPHLGRKRRPGPGHPVHVRDPGHGGRRHPTVPRCRPGRGDDTTSAGR